MLLSAYVSFWHLSVLTHLLYRIVKLITFKRWQKNEKRRCGCSMPFTIENTNIEHRNSKCCIFVICHFPLLMYASRFWIAYTNEDWKIWNTTSWMRTKKYKNVRKLELSNSNGATAHVCTFYNVQWIVTINVDHVMMYNSRGNCAQRLEFDKISTSIDLNLFLLQLNIFICWNACCRRKHRQTASYGRDLKSGLRFAAL